MNTHSATEWAKHQNGQMTLEMILLMVVLVAAAMSATKAIQSNNILSSMVGGPWAVIDGMIEDGVWMKKGDASKAQNPNGVDRHVTRQGDTP